MPAPPAVGSSPSTPGAPATPPATTRPGSSDETGPVFLDADDEHAPAPGTAAAPAWNADTSRQGGFGAPPDDPRGGNWRDGPGGQGGQDGRDGRDAAGKGSTDPAPSPSPASPADEPAPDAAEGPLSERTFRVRRPQAADAGQGAQEPPPQGGREFTVGLRRSEVLRGGEAPQLPARAEDHARTEDPARPKGPGQTQPDQPATPAPGSPAPDSPSPPLPTRPQSAPPDQRIPSQGPPAPVRAQPQLPAQAQAAQAPAHSAGLVPHQAPQAQPRPEQSHPATAAPDRSPQGAPPAWAQPPAAQDGGAGAPAPAQGHQQAALPAQPQSGGPDAVTPWRPPVNDPFAQAAQQQARPAGLGKRFGARLVDLVLTLAVAGGVAFPFVGKVTDHIDAKVDAVEQAGETKQVWLIDGTTGLYLGLVLGALVVFGLLYEVLPTARWGRTLGKKLFGLSVVHIEGHGAPGFAASLIRWLVHGLLGLVVVGLLNVLWCVFDRPWRQCWHDKVARTFVAKGATPEIRL